MNNAYVDFTTAVTNIKNFGCIYDQILENYPILNKELDDMLRAQIVNIVSALDRYIHEVVRIGIIEAYLNKRPQTPKWTSTNISLKNLLNIITVEKSNASPQKEIDLINVLDQTLKPMLKVMSFQQSDKIKDALSYIWLEEHKMQNIASSINYQLTGNDLNEKTKFLEQKLKLIVTRRNQIVHEADWDPINKCKYKIAKQDVDDIIIFVENFVSAIHLRICPQII